MEYERFDDICQNRNANLCVSDCQCYWCPTGCDIESAGMEINKLKDCWDVSGYCVNSTDLCGDLDKKIDCHSFSKSGPELNTIFISFGVLCGIFLMAIFTVFMSKQLTKYRKTNNSICRQYNHLLDDESKQGIDDPEDIYLDKDLFGE